MDQVERTPYLIILCSAHVNVSVGMIAWIGFTWEATILARFRFEKHIMVFTEKQTNIKVELFQHDLCGDVVENEKKKTLASMRLTTSNVNKIQFLLYPP